MQVDFIKPNSKDIQYIAQNMRDQDVTEVYASGGYTPIDALNQSLECSTLSSIALINDEPCAALGLVIPSLLGGIGIPWLLGTEKVVQNKKVFMKETKSGILDMLTLCDKLVNYVHKENTVSVRWLKYMGFTLYEPEPFGIYGELFHKFELGREDV